MSPRHEHLRVPASSHYAEDDYSPEAVFDRMHRGENYDGPFSPIVMTNFSVYEYWGDDEGKEFFTRNVVQTGPRTFSFNLKSMGQGPNEVYRADLLAKDRAATQVMVETYPNPISPEQKIELDAISEKIESERTVYVEFNHWNSSSRAELVSLLKLVKGDLPNRRGPNREVLEYRHAPLPWMLDPMLKKLSSQVRREPGHEEFIYEFSRGMNIEDPELFRYSYAFLLRSALQDTIKKGGDIRNAYIYGHTIKAETTKHFTNNFPWKRWKEADDYLPEGHAMFRSSIAEMLASSDLYEYFDDWKREIDYLTPGDPVRYFLFKAEVEGRHEAFLKVSNGKGDFEGFARLQFPKELIDLRIQVACAEHGISYERLKQKLADKEEPYNYNYEYYGQSESMPPQKTARVELFPPQRIAGAQGLYSYSKKKYDLSSFDFTEAKRRVLNEYSHLLKKWEAMGRPISELGFRNRKEFIAQARKVSFEFSYEHRPGTQFQDERGEWILPEQVREKRELKEIRKVPKPEFRLKKLVRPRARGRARVW